MRLLSQIFQPLITIPKNAIVKNTDISCRSQKLLMECGLIRPTSNGLYAILPLAQRSLNKLTKIICKHIEAGGGQRVTLPSLTPSALWRKSGRLSGSQELMILKDRHDKEYLLAPTHEEAITDLIADVAPLSYKQLPLVLYQVSNKYRDEFRPKHGLLRSREFQMMDAYGVHPDEASAKEIYLKLSARYRDLFQELDLNCYRVAAPTGDMGGTYSHEWHVTSTAGEDVIHVCASCGTATLSVPEQRGDGNVLCAQCGGEVRGVTSIEVGHTFSLGTRYSKPLTAAYVTSAQTSAPVTMTCYGIGITRLLAASVDSLSSEEAIRWPRNIAPFSILVVGPKEGSKQWSSHGIEELTSLVDQLSSLPRMSQEVLLDDRHTVTIGKRLLVGAKMGYPYIVVCGKGISEQPPKYELHDTTCKTMREVTLAELLRELASVNVEKDVCSRQNVLNKLC